MSLTEEIEKHVTNPHLKELEIEAEYLDTAIKRFDEVLLLADEDNMGFFLGIIKKRKDRTEKILLEPNTSSSIREQCVGAMVEQTAMLNWKQYYLNAISQAKSDLEKIKHELNTGERPDEKPNA